MEKNNYCDPIRLTQLIQQAQASGEVTDELVSLITDIAWGVWRRWGDRDDIHAWSDFRQDCLVRLIQTVQQVQLDKSLFSYYTTIFANIIRQRHRESITRLRQLHQYGRVHESK